MKKFIKKLMVAASAIVATMALSAVAVSAADTVYNMADATGLTAVTQGGTVTGVEGPITVASGVTGCAKVKFGLVDYTGNAKYNNTAPTAGPLAGTLLNKAVIVTNGVKSKDMFTISNVPSGATVGIYYFGCDSKGAAGKATSFTANGTAVSAAKGEGMASPLYTELTNVTSGTVTLTAGATSTRIALCAVVIRTGGSDPQPTTSVVEPTTQGTTSVIEPTTQGTTIYVPPVDPVDGAEVLPVINGNTRVYGFVGSGNKLVSVSNTGKSADSAYADFKNSTATGTDAENYVLLTANGAELNDYSATAPTVLIVPYSQATGKVTISGEVTPSNTDQPKKGVGSKWKLVDLGVIAVTTDSAKNLTLASNNETPATTTVGALVAGQKVTYSVTLDLDAKTASATITNGATSQTFTDVAFGAGTFDGIKFTTNGKGTRTDNSDRRLLVSNITITSEGAVADWVTEAAGDAKTSVTYKGNDYYVVSAISAADAAAATSLAQATANGQLNTSDTVYTGVVMGGKTYTAAELGGEYVFATLVTNDNATAGDTVLGNVKTVKTNLQ